MRDPKRDPAGALTEIQRWANYLPFGAVGWHLTKSTNGPTINAGIQSSLIFDTQVVDKEGFGLAPTIPKGLSGLYYMEASAYWAVGALTFIGISRVRAGVTAGIGGVVTATADRLQVNAVELLNEDDKLLVQLQNSSGAPITVNAYAGDTLNPAYPYFKGYRIALL